jgi:hypothetical protein
VIADGGADLLVHGGDGFTGGGLAEVALAQERHGGDDAAAEIDEVFAPRGRRRARRSGAADSRGALRWEAES